MRRACCKPSTPVQRVLGEQPSTQASKRAHTYTHTHTHTRTHTYIHTHTHTHTHTLRDRVCARVSNSIRCTLTGKVSVLPFSQESPRRRSTQSGWPFVDASTAAVMVRYAAMVPVGWKGSGPTSDGMYPRAVLSSPSEEETYLEWCRHNCESLRVCKYRSRRSLARMKSQCSAFFEGVVPKCMVP
jgi:hypothetical protein